MRQGIFISIEGMDGSGKTTQIGLMKDYIIQKGHDVVLTREPGGTNISEKIRSLVLDKGNVEMDKITELMLYAAARAQLVAEVIKPSVESGKVVICDRFVDSSYAYQGFGRGIDLKLLTDINRAAVDGMMPDITFFFDLSPEVALGRRMNSTIADRIESENMDFHMKVYKGYLRLAYLYPERIRCIDGKKGIDGMASEVRRILDSLV